MTAVRMLSVQEVRQVVGVFHAEVCLPAIIDYSRSIGLRIPNGPSICQKSHLVSHGRSIAP